jgi:hypothetical protein
VFSPPYLFKKDGSGELAPRPEITSAPDEVTYDAPFEVSTPDPASISKVALVRLGAVTHSVNMEQRYVPLQFTADGGVVNATAPANDNVAPPGVYMLFVVDADGVPSVAKMVQVGGATDPTPPTIASVSPLDGATGVGPSSNVVIRFSEPMDRQATEAAFRLTKDGIPVSGSFSWNAAGTELTFDPSASLASGSHIASVSTSATDEAGNALTEPMTWSFAVDATPQTTVSGPSATVILTGSRGSGGAADLNANDGVYYRVNSTTTSTKRTSWYGRFDGVPSSLQNLRVTYSGSNSRTCSQSVAIRRFTTNSWVTLNSRSVGTTEVQIASLAPPGSAANYVNGMGRVQVRVLCSTTSGSFYTSGDLLNISYQR